MPLDTTQEQELTREQILERLRQRRREREAGGRPQLEGRAPTEQDVEPASPRGELTRDQIISRLNRRKLERTTGRPSEIEGLVPPVAEPMFAQPPRPTEALEPPPIEQPTVTQPPRREPPRREPGVAPSFEEQRRTTEQIDEFVAGAGRKWEDIRETLRFGAGEVRTGVREALGAAPESVLEPQQFEGAVPTVAEMLQRRKVGEAVVSDEVSMPEQFRDYRPSEIGAANKGLEAWDDLLRVQARGLRGSQSQIADLGGALRTVWSIYAGTRRVMDAIRHPLDPEAREFTQFWERVQSGGGITAPLDERHNVLQMFGLGLAEMVPELVLLQATGVMGAARAGSVQARGAVVGALEKKFGRNAATRIFEEALEESVEEGLSVALFESVLGRGAGQGVGGRIKVFGEELLSETGGLVLGAGFGGGRQIMRELNALRGPISARIQKAKPKNYVDIMREMVNIAEERGIEPEQVRLELAREGDSSIARQLFGRLRGGAAEIGTMAEIRGERAAAQGIRQDMSVREAEQRGRSMYAEIEAYREDPMWTAALDLADNPSVGEATALRVLRRDFPRASDEQIADVVATAFKGPTPKESLEGLTRVDTGGRPVPEPAERPRARDPEERARISRGLARMETALDRQLKDLEDPDIDADTAMDRLGAIQQSADDMVSQAASAGENALVDRAARLSAQVADAIENPPARPEPEAAGAPEKPPEAPEQAGAAPTPERPAAAEEAAAGPTPEAPAKPEVAPEPTPTPEPADVVGEQLPPARRLDPEQRAEIEEIFPEASDLTDEQLVDEIASFGQEARMLEEEPTGRRLTDLTDAELEARIRQAGQELPEAGANYRDRLLEIVEPGRGERVGRLTDERRELRQRLADEIRGRRAAERGAMVDERTGLQNQKAFIQAGPRAAADPETSFVEMDVRNLKVANDEISEEAGNELIVRAAEAVRQAAEENGIGRRNIFRSGGDEFSVIAPNDVAEKIRDRAVEIMGEEPIGDTGYTSALRGGVGGTPKEASIAVGKAKKGETGRARAVEPRQERPERTLNLADEAASEAARRGEGPPSGQPIRMTGLFHGYGRAPDAEPVVKFDADPVVGPGRYSTPSKEFAGKYGPNIEELEVDLQHPMVITNDDEWRALTKAAGVAPNYSAMAAERVPKANADAAVMRKYLEAQGHDGLVVLLDDRGDMSRTTRKMFGDDTIVEFNPPARARVPEKKPTPEPTPEPEAAAAEPELVTTYEDVQSNADANLTTFAEYGKPVEILVERPDGSTDRVQANYAIVDIEELRASHIVEGSTARPNPEYPEKVQTRETVDAEFVQGRSTDAAFDEGQLVLESPTAERGPPIISDHGVVLGGNHRVNIIQQVYDNRGEARDRYVQQIDDMADQLGIDRATLEDFIDPVLVRMIKDDANPASTVEARALADDLNRTAVRSRSAVEEATLASARMGDDTLAFFDEKFEVDATMRSFLNTADGKEFVKRLREEGTISAEQVNRLFDKDGTLNSAGRDFVENVILGRALGSAEAIEQLPAAIRNRLMKAAPSIAGIGGPFDIRPALQEASMILGEQGRSGETLETFLGQQGLGLGEREWTGPGKQLASFLANTKTQKAVVESFRGYRSASDAAPIGQTELIPTAAVSPREAFQQAFGSDLLGKAKTDLGFADEMPAPKPVTPGEGPKLKLTPERIAALKKLGIEITPEQQAANFADQQRRKEIRQQRREQRRQRGEAEAPKKPAAGGRIQPKRAGERRPDAPTPTRERPPGDAGGGPAGGERGDVNPTGEPKVAKGQRARERAKEKQRQKEKARQDELEKERERFTEAEADQELVAKIENVPEYLSTPMRKAAKDASIDQKLVDDQLRDVEKIMRNLLDVPIDEAQVKPVGGMFPGRPVRKATPGFLVGNSPGTGKTYVGASVIKEVIERARAEGREARILLLVPGKAQGSIVGQWNQVLGDLFGIQTRPFKGGDTLPEHTGVFTMSHAGLGNAWDSAYNDFKLKMGKFDLVLVDESHMFANLHGAKRAQAARRLRQDNADRVLQLSATPYEFPWDMEYLENLRLWGPGSRYPGFYDWLSAHGIVKAKGTGTFYFKKSARADIMRTLLQIRREMIEAGVYTQRAMRVDKKLNNDFVEVKFDGTYAHFYQSVMDEIRSLLKRAKGVDRNLLLSNETIFTRRITELAKIPMAIKLTKKLVEQGRSVVIFTGYKIDFSMPEKSRQRFPSLAAVIDSVESQYREGVARLVRELGGDDVVGQVHGNITDKKRMADIADFQSGKKKVMVATIDSGGTGLSLHDLTGKHPRAQINLTAPWTGKAAEQLAGRTYRVGTKSDTQMIWVGVDTPIERTLIARVAAKMEALGALVQGKVDTDAAKMLMFDYLPQAEMEKQLFGFSKELGVESEYQTSLDFGGKRNRTSRTESESMAAMEKARVEFETATGLPADAQGTTPKQKAAAEDLLLPRHRSKIIRPSTIIGKAARQMLTRVFLGGIRQANVRGRFKIVGDLIRLRSSQDVRVAAHELAHHLDKQAFGFLKHPLDISQSIPAHLAPYASELAPMAYKGADDRVTEGFAEFVAEYVTNPTKAQAEAPKFFEYFRDHMNRTAPGDLRTLDWMQDQYRLYKKQPASEQIGSRIIIGDDGELENPRIVPGRRFQKWYHNVMDYHTIFRDMDQIMMRKDPSFRSLQMLARRTFGADPLAANMMERGWLDFNELENNNKVKRVSKGLPEIFKDIDKRESFDLFRYWAAARRAVELKERGLETGMEDLLEDGTVDAHFMEVEALGLTELFESAWKDLDDYQTAGLGWLVDSGVLSVEQMLAMKKMNQAYVPFHRILGEPDHGMDWVAEAKAKTGGVDGVVGLPPGVYRFKGSTRPIIDPIESIVSNTRYFAQLGFRKQVENQIVRFSDDVFGAEGHGQFITKIDPQMVASRYTVKQVKGALKVLGIELEGLTDEQLMDVITLFQAKSVRKDLPVFQAVTGGKRQWYQINDPDVWDAVAGLNKVEFGFFANAAIAGKTVLRNGVVLSPEFMLRNFIRDAQTAWIQTPARGKGVKRSIPMVAAVEGLAEAIKAGPLWDEFVASGAAGSALTQISRKSNQQYMRQMFGRKALSRQLASEHSVPWNARELYQMVKETAQGGMYALQHGGSYMENANRLSTFRAMREEGADMLQSGFAARNVSTDFAVHGAKLQMWRLSTAFLNPAAQGTARTFRQFREKPLLTIARSSMLTFTSAGLWWLNQQDPDYNEYPEQVKSRYWLWRNRDSGTIIRIPKTYIYGDVFGSLLAEAFLDYAFKKDPDIVGRLGTIMRQAFGFTLLPTWALPAIEIAMNKSMYFNTPIESPGMKDALPKEMRAGSYTSEASRRLSQGIARFAETMDASGMKRVGQFINSLNLSPVQYDHIVRGYFGTMGYDIWNETPTLIRGGTNMVRRLEGLEPYKQPPNVRLRNRFFVRAFTLRFPTNAAQSIREFYHRRELLNDIALRYAKLQGVDPDAALRYHDNHEEDIMLAPMMEQIASRLAVLQKNRSGAQTADEVDAINRDALNQAQNALKMLGNPSAAEKQLMTQRAGEVLYQREQNAPIDDVRDQINLIVQRRQLQGITEPPDGEAEMVYALIYAIPDIRGAQRSTLKRYYRNIRRGSIYEREAEKTPRRIQREYRRQNP